jgi:hypothetical protein
VTHPAITSGAAETWIARLRQIPDEHRVFDAGSKRAEMEFGIDGQMADRLLERGIPHEMREGEAVFADVDLHYLSLRIARGGMYTAAMATWAKALVSTGIRAWSDVSVRYVPYVNAGEEVEILLPNGDRERRTTEADRTGARIEVRMVGEWPPFDPHIAEVLEYVGSLDFCLIPPGLEMNSAFIRRTRLASCASAALLVVEECGRLGIEARPAFGLLLGSPFATPRNWAEVRTGGDWVPADPLLLSALSNFAGLDRELWPPTRCPGGVLLRLASGRTPIVTAGGEAIAASFITRWDAGHQAPGV